MTSNLKLERSLITWTAINPDRVADGSRVQVIYCITDAKKDIATLAKYIDELEGIIKMRGKLS